LGGCVIQKVSETVLIFPERSWKSQILC
jgi:hypothetical protein